MSARLPSNRLSHKAGGKSSGQLRRSILPSPTGIRRGRRIKPTVAANLLDPAPSLPLSNRQIAELLAMEGEKAEGHLRKAFFRAAHDAFVWPLEAAEMVAAGRSLTELSSVGPFLAKAITAWVESPPRQLPQPPELRRNFLTLAEAHRILEGHPQWRGRLLGDLQMHSTWSDGAGTIEEMAEAAVSRGYRYISITDHSQGLKIARGIDEKALARQSKEITDLNLQLKSRNFRVLKSVELNLSPEGEGDMHLSALRKLDLVLGSFHSQLRKTTDQTERYLKALANRSLHVLGHPRGRVYNYRLGLHADWRRVFAHAANLDKAVEIDCYSDRQDLDVELLQIAREEGVRISLGSDAHHPWQLVFLDLGLAAALLAGIPSERIINFLPPEELLAWAARLRG